MTQLLLYRQFKVLEPVQERSDDISQGHFLRSKEAEERHKLVQWSLENGSRDKQLMVLVDDGYGQCREWN